ncbi:MAG TPA: antitoxin [Micromonosporaceae bacterium]|nr:antitoxin [Micromonosporaceae bacterium]
MGMMDKAKDMAAKAKDKVSDEQVEKAGDVVDEKTGGKHADKVDKAQETAREKLGPDQQQ